MKRTFILLLSLFVSASLIGQGVTLKGIKSAPFPNELTASSQGTRIAWAFNEEGKRNVYVAEGPDYRPKRLTNYMNDDGQELTSLSLSADGKWVVFVRGGDHGSNWEDGLPVNPGFTATPYKVQVLSVPFAGGDVKSLAEGDVPTITPKGTDVTFIKSGQVWTVPIDGASAAKNLFTTRGSINSFEWSPDGSKLVFSIGRGDHSFIGVFTNTETPIQWLVPDFNHDTSPQWSPDGTRVTFIRTPGNGGAPDSVLSRRHRPWSVWMADIRTGKATQLWKAPTTLRGSYPTTQGGPNLHWAAGERVTFLSYHDGWPHLYSVSTSQQGGWTAASRNDALSLTPGNFMAEYIKLSGDGKWLVFCANAGADKLDLDRRHVVRVPVDKPAMEVLTPGAGNEWTPVVTGDGSAIAYISATAQRAPLPTVMTMANKQVKLLGQEMITANFPEKSLVTPRKVTFNSSDGVVVHADAFEQAGGFGKKPAIIYIHGGPPRQMLLGWHYSDYYSNAYASNQYLTSLGFVVLSVNYRLGIGYGFDFHQPPNAGTNGAAEYLDVKAAGEWLAKQPNVDASKIGVYGGSYGGYLVALALAKDSKLFAAGVDIHGVHDRTIDRTRNMVSPDKYEKAPDADKALQVGWQSSPTAFVNTWTSPVLIIHGDDDRNVRFSQSTDLVRRLDRKGVEVETMVVVDDTHHWMKHTNALAVYQATADYFVKKFMNEKKPLLKE